MGKCTLHIYIGMHKCNETLHVNLLLFYDNEKLHQTMTKSSQRDSSRLKMLADASFDEMSVQILSPDNSH